MDISASPVAATRPGARPATPSTPVARPRAALTPTVHSNPDWARQLKSNFKAEVIDTCSSRAQKAANVDQYIEVEI